MSEDIDQLRKQISVEYFETFDPATQLKIIKNLKSTMDIIRATGVQADDLLDFLESRLGELQIIYNIHSNRSLSDFY